jgi:hypothetical protein
MVLDGDSTEEDRLGKSNGIQWCAIYINSLTPCVFLFQHAEQLRGNKIKIDKISQGKKKHNKLGMKPPKTGGMFPLAVG